MGITVPDLKCKSSPFRGCRGLGAIRSGTSHPARRRVSEYRYRRMCSGTRIVGSGAASLGLPPPLRSGSFLLFPMPVRGAGRPPFPEWGIFNIISYGPITRAPLTICDQFSQCILWSLDGNSKPPKSNRGPSDVRVLYK